MIKTQSVILATENSISVFAIHRSQCVQTLLFLSETVKVVKVTHPCLLLLQLTTLNVNILGIKPLVILAGNNLVVQHMYQCTNLD